MVRRQRSTFLPRGVGEQIAKQGNFFLLKRSTGMQIMGVYCILCSKTILRLVFPPSNHNLGLGYVRADCDQRARLCSIASSFPREPEAST